MEVYGIRLKHSSNYGAIDGITALEEARRAIEEGIGINSLVGTRASHSLEETFFLVRERCLAQEAVDAMFDKCVPAEYVPLTVSEEPCGHEQAEIIEQGFLRRPLV